MLTFLSDSWCKDSPKHRSASLSPSTARSSRRISIRHHIRPLSLLVPESYRDEEGVLSSNSSVFWNRRVNTIYYETIKVCDPLYLFSRAFDLTSMNMKPLYTLPTIGEHSRRPSSLYYFVGSQADNIFYLDSHTPATVPLRPQRRRGRLRNVSASVGSRLGQPLWRCITSTSRPLSFPDIACVLPHRLIEVLIIDCLAITSIK